MDRLVLIDGHALLHRAYHAYPALTTSQGKLVNAVYGFTSILLTVLRQLKPQYAACAFDLAKPTFRHKKFKAYKAHRPQVDEELKQQIPLAHQVVAALNIPIFEVEGYEADDLIGTLCRQAKELEEIIIVTGDNDVLQLTNEKVKVLLPSRGQKPAQIYDGRAVNQKYGFAPEKLVDFKALAGDASDALPGVKGIGPKTAAKLIQSYGSLKNIYAHLREIEPRWREKLAKDQKQAFLSYKLAAIVTRAPVKLNLKKCLLADYDRQKVVKLFSRLEFNSLLKKLPGKELESGLATPKKQRIVKEAENKNNQMKLF